MENHLITFADLGYSVIPSVKKLNSYDELHDAINQSLTSSVDPNFIKKYIDALDQHSFNFHMLDFINRYGSMFYFNGNLVDVLIDEKQMKSFLTNNEKELEELSLEFVKKINYYESITTK